GHFLPWGEMLDLFEEITGRRFHRWPVPGAVLRASGAAADVVRRVWDFELPLTREATIIMTRWIPAQRITEADARLGISFRDPRETLRDTLRWMHARGIVSAARVGALGGV